MQSVAAEGSNREGFHMNISVQWEKSNILHSDRESDKDDFEGELGYIRL